MSGTRSLAYQLSSVICHCSALHFFHAENLEVSELLSIFADEIIIIKYDKDNKHFAKCARNL